MGAEVFGRGLREKWRNENDDQNPIIDNPSAKIDENPQVENPSKQPTATLQMGSPQAEPVETIEGEDDEFWPLSGKPYFSVVLTRTHVKPSYHMYFPAKIQPSLPYATVPLIIKYCGKQWKAVYFGEGCHKRLDVGWKNFVIDNNLKVGDAVVFELLESSNEIIKFRVQILGGEFPDELMHKVKGMSSDTHVILDD